MRMRIATPIVLASLALSFSGVAAATPTAQPLAKPASCDPVTTKPHFQGSVPTPRHVLGYELGSKEASDQDIYKYWHAVDKASPRVETGVYAHSYEGRRLPYALVGTPQTLHRLPAIRRDLARLRDPSTPPAEAKEIIKRTPTILWIAANVHGNEPAGGDAVLGLLYNLADRDDCVADAILDNAVVGLIPTQNPDGRANDERYNAYAFDMNRDWFARTQPETAGKLDLLWKYPPQVFVDEHEMGGSNYFFPPDSDPIYHETPDPIYHEIAKMYGDANADAFTRLGWNYETWQSGYDLFYQGYGDSVPTTEFGAAGMTYEQGEGASYPDRTEHHFMAGLVTLYTGATHRETVLQRWRSDFVDAENEGANCRLEPNATFNPGHHVQRQVPKRPVCGYFLTGHSPETRLVVRRLQLAHVKVDRLSRSTVVDDYRPYGMSPRRTTMPAGTFWITLDQPQKHWVQAMLNEDTYVPFPYFYDVSGWSNPLLAGIPGGSTGQPVTAPMTRVGLLPPGQAALPSKLPRVAVLDQFDQTIDDYQTTGWLKWRLEHEWHVPYTVIQPKQVSDSTLRDVDVLLVPNVDANPVYNDLGESGRQALQDWVQNGGRYVGWQEGASLASALHLSSVGLSKPQAQSPGAVMRIHTTRGLNEILWDNYYGLQMTAGDARVVAAFPRHMFVSGYATKANTLAGTPVEAVDDVGAGSVTVFSFEPNFRAFTDGSARLLRCAMLHTPRGSVASVRRAGVAPVRSGRAALTLGHPRAQRLAYDNHETP
jgi:hypothetical protein